MVFGTCVIFISKVISSTSKDIAFFLKVHMYFNNLIDLRKIAPTLNT